jgi:ankyrin repeat protein
MGWNPGYLLTSFLLYIYFSTGKLQIVYLLLSHNASLNTEDNDGSSTLHHAAKNGHAEVVLELIEAGASIESTDSGDWTPLIWVLIKYILI